MGFVVALAINEEAASPQSVCIEKINAHVQERRQPDQCSFLSCT